MNHSPYCLPITKLFIDIEARTGFQRVQVVMAHDDSAWITLLQFPEQTEHRPLLCLGARVGRIAADVESALIAHSDGVLVMVLAVCAHHVFRSSHFQRSVPSDHVVVAYAKVKTSLAVPRIYLCC